MKYMTNAELVRQYAEFIKCFGDSLLSVAENLAKNPINLYPIEDSTESAPVTETPEPTTPSPEIAAEKEITQEDVRSAFSRLVRVKNNEAAKAILNKYNAKLISALDKKDYASVLKEVEELINASD